MDTVSQGFDDKLLFRSILDSLTQQICIIDDEGMIEWVNQSWADFAVGNDGKSLETGIHLNYLHTCSQSANAGDKGGKQALQGIKEVLDGRRPVFYFEYPCHTKTEKRWFMMRVVPLKWEGPRRFVISHQNITERKLAEEKVHELAIVDGLTGTFNRRYFNDFFSNEWLRVQRQKQAISLILLDIDFFKSFNDNYGHVAGDDCLKKVGDVLKAFAKRPSDLVARYGGEEFAIVLGNTNLSNAEKIAHDVRGRVFDLNIPHEYSTSNQRVTISAGVATAYPSQGTSETDLIKVADLGLYAAKEAGRNYVSVNQTLIEELGVGME